MQTRTLTLQKMVQSLNTKAIWTLANIIRRPSLLVPQQSVDTVSQVDYAKLQEQHSIRAIIFDKDHTLTAPYDSTLHVDARVGIQRCRQVFGDEQVAILSNSAGTRDDENHQDAERIEATLGIRVIRHDEKKPGGFHEVMHHFADVVESASDVCIVGDRILTDIVFGNLHGMYTIHTKPLSLEDNSVDNWTARLIRPLENRIMYSSWTRGFWKRRRIPHKGDKPNDA